VNVLLWICCCLSATVYLPLYLLCCISATVSATVYQPLCLLCCISTAVSAVVYPPLYIYLCDCCIVESDRVHREIESSIVQKWLATELCNSRIRAFICLTNLKFAGDGRVTLAVENGRQRMKICEWVYTNDSVH
jgi:predicted nucleic acid-binding Zn ribbon protein